MSSEAPSQTFERVTDDSVGGILADVQASFGATNQAGAQPTVEPTPAPEQQPTPTQQPTDPAVPPTAPLEEPPATEPEPVAAAAEAKPEPDTALIPSPESRLAPLFELTSLPQAEALPRAIDVITDLHRHDPIAYALFANAVIQASPKVATALALEKSGIAPEKITQFNDWIAKGGDALPEPVAYPAFDTLVQPLESPEDTQWVRLSNGLELNLLDQRDKAHFELEKRLYDADVRDKVAARESAIATQKADDERKQNEAMIAHEDFLDRVDFYTAGRYGIIKSTLDPIISKLAPEDKFKGEMLLAYANSHIDNHDEVKRLSQQASPYVKEGHGFKKGQDGKWKMSGRAAEFATQQDRIIKRELNTLVDQFNKDLLRVNRAELAATATEPKIGEAVAALTSNAPQPPSFEPQPNETVQDILAEAREYERRMRAGG
jgi:hypothetical protein